MIQKKMSDLRIAFIGSVGVPNVYGGFEIFLESCTPSLVNQFKEVIVTCDSTRYEKKDGAWRGVKRIFVPIKANGFLSIFHDVYAFIKVFWRVDVVIVLGISAGIFFPVFRLFCDVFGKKLLCNVDGIEARRSKFSILKKIFLIISDVIVQKFTHQLIIDNEALLPFLNNGGKRKAQFIAYPGDHVIRFFGSPPKNSGDNVFLTICRIEPENNCELLLSAFAAIGAGSYVFVGNWSSSNYGRDLKRRFNQVPGLEMRDPIYDPTTLAELREGCDCYLHGHSVGGTNPSLVEMLFYDCPILAFDCVFNRSTAGRTVEYFQDCEDLVGMLKKLPDIDRSLRSKTRKRYTRDKISQEYACLIEEVARVGA